MWLILGYAFSQFTILWCLSEEVCESLHPNVVLLLLLIAVCYRREGQEMDSTITTPEVNVFKPKDNP